MRLRFPFLLIVFFLVSVAPVLSQKANRRPDVAWLALLEQNLAGAAAQYRMLVNNLPADSFPLAYYPQTGRLETCASDNWSSGFFPGTLLLLFGQTKDSSLYLEAVRRMKLLQKEQFNKSSPGLGCMLYNSFGNALRIAPQAEYKHILINSARSLASRFQPKVGCFPSRDSAGPGDFPVSIDNLGCLELLFWAAKATGDRSLYQVAVTHANTTLRHHFRPDFGAYEVLLYDGRTGAVKRPRAARGAADSSAWARGQGWGLYGYTVLYRETRDPKYLEQAKNIARFILSHPRLPADKVPYWDFDAPAIPDALRDASAGALMASALLELGGYVDKKLAREYFGVADTLLHTLSSPEFRAAPGTNGGFLLQRCAGLPAPNGTVEGALPEGDYYYVEALQRYREYFRKK
ncbi:glucuronyl hydrolase [Paraflavisolibacter sp. H34]|uniref:glucuronyl hydrolase n=1 Tax=Huijunlia imazamoxiresistens TaxID=3127457 RepID=UPI003019BB71